jgi:hypothetical protein
VARHLKIDQKSTVTKKGKKKKKKKGGKKHLTPQQKEYRIDKEYWHYLRLQLTWSTFGGCFISFFELCIFALSSVSMDY